MVAMEATYLKPKKLWGCFLEIDWYNKRGFTPPPPSYG
jgi:hypothetical protein